MKLKAQVAAVWAIGLCFIGGCNSCGETDSASSGWVKPKTDASADGPSSDAALTDAATDKDGAKDGPALDVINEQTVSDATQDKGGDVALDVAVEAHPDALAEASVPDVDFGYDGGAVTPWSKLPTKCTAAAEKGLAWLVQQQKADGAWGTVDPYMMAATGLAVVKLQTYAIENGKSPFHPNYIFNKQVQLGLDYIFKNLQTAPVSGANDTNNDGLGVTMGDTLTNYVSSIALMAVTAGQGFDQTVNVPGSPVDGWKYQRVAQDMVDYFAACQVGQGGWRYTCPSGDADNSVSQYVTLALEYAEHPDYQFLCTVPPTVSTGLQTWVTTVQSMAPGADYGGSGYTTTDWVNPYKTGALLQQFAFLKQGPGVLQVQAALQYLDTNWSLPISPNPAEYMTMWSIMKGLVTQGVVMVGAHDWYTEYCDLLVAQQQADGSWPLSLYDSPGSDGVLSTTWALLVLEKAAPAKLY